MAATPIAALNKTTQNSFLRIIEFSRFSLHLVHWASSSGDARTRSATRAGAVKGQGADCWLFRYLPLNAVICRGLDTVRGVQSGVSGPASGFATTAEQIRRAPWANTPQTHSHLRDPRKTGSIRGRRSQRTSTAT